MLTGILVSLISILVIVEVAWYVDGAFTAEAVASASIAVIETVDQGSLRGVDGVVTTLS